MLLQEKAEEISVQQLYTVRSAGALSLYRSLFGASAAQFADRRLNTQAAASGSFELQMHTCVLPPHTSSAVPKLVLLLLLLLLAGTFRRGQQLAFRCYLMVSIVVGGCSDRVFKLFQDLA